MKKYIYRTLSFLLAVSFLTSCLKDDSLVLDPEKGRNVIEFANPAQIGVIGSVHPLYTFALESGSAVPIPITISYSGPESGAPEDIVVNFDAGTQAEVTAYNEDQEKAFDLMPSDIFTLSTKSVVIKKGEKKATFNALFATERFDFDKSYVLPLKITSTSSGIVSGNFGTILLSVNPKNIYDGIYTLTGTFNDTQRSDFTGAYPIEIHLVTQNAKSVAFYDDENLGNYGHFFNTPDGGSYYGNFAPVFNFDDQNNVVSVVNFYGQPSSNGRSGRIDVTGVNKYDPATKTLEVSYVMVQGGDRTFFKEKMVYVGPRP